MGQDVLAICLSFEGHRNSQRVPSVGWCPARATPLIMSEVDGKSGCKSRPTCVGSCACRARGSHKWRTPPNWGRPRTTECRAPACRTQSKCGSQSNSLLPPLVRGHQFSRWESRPTAHRQVRCVQGSRGVPNAGYGRVIGDMALAVASCGSVLTAMIHAE